MDLNGRGSFKVLLNQEEAECSGLSSIVRYESLRVYCEAFINYIAFTIAAEVAVT